MSTSNIKRFIFICLSENLLLFFVLCVIKLNMFGFGENMQLEKDIFDNRLIDHIKMF